MIGQTKITERLHRLIEEKKFPRFSILVGREGSGRRTLAHEEIAPYLNKPVYELTDVKIDAIREMIEVSYHLRDTLFIIPNADRMSMPTMNATLKITEEPPNGNYYLMTIEDERSVLDTILSRATVYHMDEYTTEEIKKYYAEVSNKTDNIEQIITICQTPGDVDKLKDNISDFCGYVDKVVDNIHRVSGANSFKIADKLALNGENDKYDLCLFLRAFSIKCLGKFIEPSGGKQYSRGVIITAKYLNELTVPSVNKRMLFDNWLLDIRAEWLQYANN